MKLKNKKGFTIIELIVVIAILGILVLLAMWGYKGYVEKAKLVQIKHDVKVAEQLLAADYLAKDTSLPDNWVSTNPQNSVNNIYDKRGLVEPGNVEPGDYKLFPKDEIGSKLPGNFHAKDDGKVYYEDKASSGDSESEDDSYIEQPPLTDDEINDLISQGYIPVANAEELQRINDTDGVTPYIWGAGTKYEGNYVASLDSNYIQVADINLSEYSSWKPIGASYSETFNGNYDGGNYIIENLNIDNYIYGGNGLFGILNGNNQEFSNIRINNANVNIYNKDDWSSLEADAAILIGLNNSSGLLNLNNIRIENAYVSASKSSAGLIGESNGNIGDIKDVYVKGNFDSHHFPIAWEEDDITTGGLIGLLNGSVNNIENINVEAVIDGDVIIGGLVGQVNGDVENINNIDLDIEIQHDVLDSILEDYYGEYFVETFYVNSGGLIGYVNGNINNINDVKGTVKTSSTEDGEYYYDGDIYIFLERMHFAGLIGGVTGNIINTENIYLNVLMDVEKSTASGLIGYVNNIDKLKNINIQANIKSYYSAHGGIGSVNQIDLAEDVTLNGIIEGDTASGFFGYVDANIINNFLITADVDSNFTAGLINKAGTINNLSNIEIRGNITGTSSSSGLINTSTGDLNINAIEIHGDISAIYDRVYKGSTQVSRAAGLIASIDDSSVEISNVKIYGDISSKFTEPYGATSAQTVAGGIVGNSYTQDNIKLSNVEYVGNITATEVGGLIGSSQSPTEINDAIVNGKIVEYVFSGYTIGGIGGLIGSMTDELNISNINISGEIEAYFPNIVGNGIGGIVGISNAGINMDNVNISSIIRADEDVGIIIGRMNGSHNKINGDYSFTGNLVHQDGKFGNIEEIGYIFSWY